MLIQEPKGVMNYNIMGNPLINYEILYIPIEWCIIDVWTQIPIHMLKSQDLNT
jgi:hypothetical protein